MELSDGGPLRVGAPVEEKVGFEAEQFDCTRGLDAFHPIDDADKKDPERSDVTYYLGYKYHQDMKEDGWYRIVWVKPKSPRAEGMKKPKNLIHASPTTIASPQGYVVDCCIFVDKQWMRTQLHLSAKNESVDAYECKLLEERPNNWQRFAVRVRSNQVDGTMVTHPSPWLFKPDAEEPPPFTSEAPLIDAFPINFAPSETVFGMAWHNVITSGERLPSVYVFLEDGVNLKSKSRICPLICYGSTRTLIPCVFPFNGCWYRTVIHIPSPNAKCCDCGFYKFKVCYSINVFCFALFSFSHSFSLFFVVSSHKTNKNPQKVEKTSDGKWAKLDIVHFEAFVNELDCLENSLKTLYQYDKFANIPWKALAAPNGEGEHHELKGLPVLDVYNQLSSRSCNVGILTGDVGFGKTLVCLSLLKYWAHEDAARDELRPFPAVVYVPLTFENWPSPGPPQTFRDGKPVTLKEWLVEYWKCFETATVMQKLLKKSTPGDVLWIFDGMDQVAPVARNFAQSLLVETHRKELGIEYALFVSRTMPVLQSSTAVHHWQVTGLSRRSEYVGFLSDYCHCENAEHAMSWIQSFPQLESMCGSPDILQLLMVEYERNRPWHRTRCSKVKCTDILTNVFHEMLDRREPLDVDLRWDRLAELGFFTYCRKINTVVSLEERKWLENCGFMRSSLRTDADRIMWCFDIMPKFFAAVYISRASTLSLAGWKTQFPDLSPFISGILVRDRKSPQFLEWCTLLSEEDASSEVEHT